MTDKQFTLTAVQALPPARLRLTFADGYAACVDLAAVIAAHPTLAALRGATVFEQVALDEWGGCVRWAGRDDLELAADNLRALAIEQAGQASHETVIAWMVRHNLTLDEAAQALGLSRRMVAYYRSGTRPVPRTVALAMKGWEVEQAVAA